MAVTTVFTSNQAKITLSVPGVTLGSTAWDKFTGGGRTAETQQHTPGGMQPSIATGGVTKRNQITLERAWDPTLVRAYGALDGAVGQPCSVGVQPLKNRTTTAGTNRSYTGVIREVTPPEQDSGTSTVAMLQVVIEANEAIQA